MESLAFLENWYWYLPLLVSLLPSALARKPKQNPIPLEMYKSLANDRHLTGDDLDRKFFVYNGSEIKEFDITNDSRGNLTMRAWQESTIVNIYVFSTAFMLCFFTALRTTFLDCYSRQLVRQSACVRDAVGTGFAFLASIAGYGAATYGLVCRWRGWRLKSRSADFIWCKYFDNYDLKLSHSSQSNIYSPDQVPDYPQVVQFGDQLKTWLIDNPTCGPILIDFWRAGEKVMMTRWDGGEAHDWHFHGS
ncbi:hypothetical protein V1517DRAFT_320003 [Lipomyces orientalis]|uniref:Uncharacterized protein n=1 Tax=Lipomyces orientalis TaxID=1233043 RepID=A0ACC3TR68_9ASCO